MSGKRVLHVLDEYDPEGERRWFPNLGGDMDEPTSIVRVSAGHREGEILTWRGPVAHEEQQQVTLSKPRTENATYHQTSTAATPAQLSELSQEVL